MPSLKAMNKAAKSKKPSVPKKKPEKKPSITISALSSEYVQGSDLENDEKESESDDDSLPEDPADALPRFNGKLPAPDGSSSESENESESEENEEESEDEAPKQGSLSVKPVEKPAKEPGPAPQAVTSQPPAPYKPPAGFESSSIGGTVQAATTFKKSSLEGKQIWYFTAPASVPITSLKEASLLAVKTGEKVFSHDNNDYGFIQDTAEDKTYTKIMVPNSADDGYKTVSKPIDQILHLQRIVKIPGVDGSDETSSKATVPAKKPVRPQPKGLKMRFLPIGFGTGQPGEIGLDAVNGSSTESASDEEMEDAQKPFKTPASLHESSSESSDEDEEMTEAPLLPTPKHTKTSKHDKSPKKSADTPSSSQSLKRKHSGGDKKSKHNKTERLEARQSISVN